MLLLPRVEGVGQAIRKVRSQFKSEICDEKYFFCCLSSPLLFFITTFCCQLRENRILYRPLNIDRKINLYFHFSSSPSGRNDGDNDEGKTSCCLVSIIVWKTNSCALRLILTPSHRFARTIPIHIPMEPSRTDVVQWQEDIESLFSSNWVGSSAYLIMMFTTRTHNRPKELKEAAHLSARCSACEKAKFWRLWSDIF